jgi:hypothetical protein
MLDMNRTAMPPADAIQAYVPGMATPWRDSQSSDALAKQQVLHELLWHMRRWRADQGFHRVSPSTAVGPGLLGRLQSLFV